MSEKIKEQIDRTISNLCDEEYQSSVWLGKVPGNFDSAIECYCTIRDDIPVSRDLLISLGYDEEVIEIYITIVNTLDEHFKRFPFPDSDDELLSSDEWKQVRKKIKELLSALKRA